MILRYYILMDYYKRNRTGMNLLMRQPVRQSGAFFFIIYKIIDKGKGKT